MIKKNLRASSTYADIIYQDIKDEILTGKLKPNEKITISQVAQHFNVSITPVREAIQRLATEEYLNVTSRSDVKVIDLAKEDYGKIIDLIRLLDIASIKKAITEFSAENIEKLKGMHLKLQAQYHSNNLKQYLNQNNAIHRQIWVMYDNKYIYQTLSQALDKFMLIASNYPSYYNPDLIAKSWTHHCRLIEAIEGRDFTLAERTLIEHWSPDFFIV